jgi:hypothetical protein
LTSPAPAGESRRVAPVVAVESDSCARTALPARAEPPSGSYVIDVGGDQSIVVPIEFEDSTCETAEGVTVCIAGAIGTDGSGAVTGNALVELSGDIEGELEATLSGAVRGSTQKTKVRLVMEMNGAVSSGGLTLDVEAKGKFKCVENAPAGFLCRGRLKLCAFASGKRVGCESDRLDLELEDAGGPWQLRLLDLATDGSGEVTGTAEVTLATDQILQYDVSGKYSARKDTANLRPVAPERRARSSLSKSARRRNRDGRQARVRVVGQKGKVELPTPPPLGTAFAGHGTFINGGFADASGDTADLFNGARQELQMPFNGVIFFPALSSLSRTR